MKNASSIIEICYYGVWKSVCESLSAASATILCKELGFYGRSGNYKFYSIDQAFMLRKNWSLIN